MDAKLDLSGISCFDPDANTLLLGLDGKLGEKNLITILSLQILQMITRRETYFFILQDLNSRKFLKHCVNLGKKGHSSQPVMF